MSLTSSLQPRVPPGFRFHPTEEELVDYYLKRKVESKKIDLNVIREIDLYKLEPWDLQERCRIGTSEQNEWYFFSHKDKKYPTGTRTNRATAAGFWKATGRDKAIYISHKLIGMRKTLVFYKGRAPNGLKTDWIMHEYRLENCENGCSPEEGWVICRVFIKRIPNIKKSLELSNTACCYDDHFAFLPELDLPKICPHGNLAYNHPCACKKKIEPEFQLLHDPFMQLPQLESPKVACYASSSNTKGLILDNATRIVEYQSNFCFDAANFEGTMAQTGVNLTAMPLSATHNEEQKVTDWRVLDRLVASQLSQDGSSKEVRIASSAADPLGDLPLLLPHNKPANQDYSASNDVDLWSFAKKDIPSGLFH